MTKKLQLLRNSSSYDSKLKALNALKAKLAILLVGEPAIVWYTENDKTKVILGISAGNGNYQIFDTEAIPAEVQKIIDRLDGEEEVSGSVKNLIKTAIEALDKVDSAVTNQYVSAVSEDNGVISVSRKQMVGTDDKVLTFTENGITSTIKLKKVTTGLQGTEKEKYQLVGIGDEVLGDVITINKDQSFKGAQLINKGQGEPPVGEDTLRLTYVDGESGKDVNVDIPLGSFLRESEFKNGLSVNGGEVSVKIAEAGVSDNFLVYEGVTEGQKALAVREMKTSVTKVSKTIPVAGGPLADLVSEVYPKGISEGEDMQTILMNLLCKEIYPNATVSNGALSSSFAQPNVTVSSAGTTVEVGTVVNVGAFTAYEPNNTPKARTYSGFTNGYSAADDNTMDAAGNPASVSVSEISMNTGTYTITRTYSKFTGVSKNVTTASGAVPTEVTIPSENTAIVQEGSNTVKFDISGPGHKGKVVASPEYFIVSNLGNTDASKKVATQNEQNLSNTNATASTRTYTVTGAYKYFVGYSGNTEFSQFDSTSVRALTTKSGNLTASTIVVGASSIASNGSSIVVACPNTYELKSVNNALGADIKPNFSSVGEVSVTTGTIQTPYTVYVYPITNGAVVEYKNLVIGKK